MNRHPVSLLSISDYHTRSRANGSKSDSSPFSIKFPNEVVAGALLGLQTGREVTVEIVFELAFTENETIDEQFLTSRLDQCLRFHVNGMLTVQINKPFRI